jgi:protein TonB
MQNQKISERTRSVLVSLLLHGALILLVLPFFLLKKNHLTSDPQSVSLSEIGHSMKSGPSQMPAEPTREVAPSANSDSENMISVTSGVAESTGKKEIEDQKLYYLELQRRIQEQERYPKEAQKRGISGVISVQFQLNDQGQITEIHANSQGKPDVLVEAALASVRAASPFSPPPAGISRNFEIPVDFKIK